MEAIEEIQLCVLFLLVLAMGIFFSKKLYFHLEFLKMHDKKFKELSLLDVFINPLLFLEVFYIFIPVFIKSGRRKEGRELFLETKIAKCILVFWLSLASLVVFLVVTEYLKKVK